MCHFLQAGRRLWKAPLVSQLFPFLWAEPHHADVSLFCEGRSWQSDFSNGRSRITAWVARFLLERSWRTVSVACYLTNVSVCFIQLSKSCGESVLLSCKSSGRAGKRGLNKSYSAVTACYSSSISKVISNPIMQGACMSIIYTIFQLLSLCSVSSYCDTCVAFV